MKTLIVFYSFTGNNEKLTAYLQGHIGCDVSKLETMKKRTGFSVFLDIVFSRKPVIKSITHNLKNYDHVIFSSPIWAGKIAMPLNSFLGDNAKDIKDYSFITVCGGGNLSQKQNIIRQLTAVVGHAPENVFEFWTKKIMATRKNRGVSATTVRIENEEIKLFNKELNEFIELLRMHDELVANEKSLK